MIDYDFLIISKVLSYTEAEKIDVEEIERLEIKAKLWHGL
jgi:hypothetical protein